MPYLPSISGKHSTTSPGTRGYVWPQGSFPEPCSYNKLAKHLPNQDEVTAELQTVLRVPTNESSAHTQIDGLMKYLDQQIQSGETTREELQPNTTPFFISAFWHMQRPEEWPIMYSSARKALHANGILDRQVKGGDGYLKFARLFSTLAKEN